MTDWYRDSASITSEVHSLLAETPWHIAITSQAGALKDVSRPLYALLGLGEPELAGRDVATLLADDQRAAFQALYAQLHPGAMQSMRTRILVAGQLPLAAEIELHALEHDLAGNVLVVIYPLPAHSGALLHELSLLAQQLHAAWSPAELFSSCMRVLGPLGISMWVTQLTSNRAALHTAYVSVNARLLALLSRSLHFDIEHQQLPLNTPVLGEVLAQGRALAQENIQPLIEALLPQRLHNLVRSLARFTGKPSAVAAPLMQHGAPGGVLVLWGQALPPAAIPAIEAFAHQLSTALDQIALRQVVQRHEQLLESLGLVGQAVSTMSTVEEVLRVICEQAQHLLGAAFITITQPVPGEQMLECTMAQGADTERWIGMRAPYDRIIAGQVMLTGSAVHAPVVAPELAAYSALRTNATVHSSLAQPLLHQGAIIGVLTVGHGQPDFFSAADLEYLGRYAAYAAIAIVNARLLATLQESERAQQRHQRELSTMLEFSRTLNTAADPDAVLQAGFRAIEAHGLANIASALITDAQLATVLHAAYHNIPAEFHAQVQASLHDPALVSDMHAGQIHVYGSETGRQLAWEHPALTPLLPNQAVAIPLYTADQTHGVLFVGRQADQAYTPHERQMLQTIGNQLAQAIARLHTHAAFKTAAEDYAALYRDTEAVRLYLDTLIQNSPVLLLSLRSNKIHIINPERLTQAQHQGRVLEGRNMLEIIPARLHATLFERCRLVRAGQPQHFELDLSEDGGTALYVRVAATLIAEYDEVLAIVQDITEARHTDAQMRQNEKLTGMGRMLAGAAHELNNPLAAILGLAQLQLLSDDHPPQLRDDLTKIEQATLRARTIVLQLLTLARAHPPTARPVAPAALITDTLERLAVPLAAGQISVEHTLDADLPPIDGDPEQLQQALFNIMHNAVLSLCENPPSAPRQLTVHAQGVRDHVLITVADTGAGIAPNHRTQIFEPFFTTRPVGQGTGLGLALCHAIILQHGGTLWAHSQPGQGATFFVQLPTAEHSREHQRV